MKLFADMHVHSKFSIDGTSTMEEYCLTAEKTGSNFLDQLYYPYNWHFKCLHCGRSLYELQNEYDCEGKI